MSSDHTAWHERWQTGRIGFHLDQVNPHLAMYWPTMALSGDTAVFVPLCGKSVDLHWLADRHRLVVGVELSRVAIDAFFNDAGIVPTRQEAGTLICWSGENIRIYEGDFFSLTKSDLFGASAFFDRAALIAVPPSVRQAYVAHLATLLPQSGIGLLVTVDYRQSEMSGPPFAVSDDALGTLVGSSFTLERLGKVDVLAKEPKFSQRGVTRMHEACWRLQCC